MEVQERGTSNEQVLASQAAFEREALFKAIQKKDEAIRQLQLDFDRVVERLTEKNQRCDYLSDALESTRRMLKVHESRAKRSEMVSKLKNAFLEPQMSKSQPSDSEIPSPSCAAPSAPPPPPPNGIASSSEEIELGREESIGTTDYDDCGNKVPTKSMSKGDISKVKSCYTHLNNRDELKKEGDKGGHEAEHQGNCTTSGVKNKPPRFTSMSVMTANRTTSKPKEGTSAFVTPPPRRQRKSLSAIGAERDALVLQLRREEDALRHLVAEKESERSAAEERAGALSRDLQVMSSRFARISAEFLEVKSQAEEENDKCRQEFKKELRRHQDKIESLQAWIEESSKERTRVELELNQANEQKLKFEKVAKEFESASRVDYKEKLRKEKVNSDKLQAEIRMLCRKLDGKERELKQLTEKVSSTMEGAKLERKIETRKRNRMLAELKKELQERETSKELMKIRASQLQLLYEEARIKLNLLSEKKPPMSIPPPPPHALLPTDTGADNASPTLYGESGSPPLLPPGLSSMRSSDSPNSNSGATTSAKPPPPRWSREAEKEYFLQVGKRLEEAVDANYRLQKQIQALTHENEKLRKILRSSGIYFSKENASQREATSDKGLRSLEDTLEENRLLRDTLKQMASKVRGLSEKVNRYKSDRDSNEGGVEVKSSVAIGSNKHDRGNLNATVNLENFRSQQLPTHSDILRTRMMAGTKFDEDGSSNARTSNKFIDVDML